ncbi:hypothetical protein GCM10028791_05070 [Echinicola sediminis]
MEVQAIYQDHYGFLWFGTSNGLNRFDGHEYLQFHHDENDPKSLSSNQINTIIEDAQQQLWIGTKYGLNRFDRDNNTFTSYLPVSNDSSALPGKNIKVLFLDQSQNLWIGTNQGLSKYQADKDHFINYFHQENNPNSIVGNSVNQIIQDSKGRLWIGTNYSGVSLYEPDKDLFTNYRHEAGNPNSLSGNTIISLFEDSYQNIWIGTIRSGLNRFEEHSKTFKRYSQGAHRGSIATNSIYSITENMDRDLIIGGMQGGMSVYNRTSDTFIRYNTKGKINLKGNTASVLTDFTTKDKQILIATSNGGVNIYDNYPSNFTSFQHSPDDESSLSIDHITDILQDSKGRIWVGTDGGGINLFDLEKGLFTPYLKQDLPGKLMDNTILKISETQEEDILLLGTQLHGLVRFDVKRERFEPIAIDLPASEELLIHDILNDSKGNTWIGTEGGLFFLAAKNKNSKTIPVPGINSPVHCIVEEGDHILIGTDNGIIKTKPGADFSIERSPLPQQSESNKAIVLGIAPKGRAVLLGTKNDGFWLLEEGQYVQLEVPKLNLSKISNLHWQDHEIWFSADNGLYRGQLDRKKAKINITGHYTTADGLAGNHFSQGSLEKTRNGHFLIGGINGLSLFHPDSLKTNPHEPSIAFTNLYINNKKIQQGTAGLLEKDINATTSITLPDGSNDITLEFSSLNFIKPDKNRYAYRLEGWEEDWNYSHNHKAAYVDLPPGKYTFRVIGSNNDGIWNNEGRTIDIIVKSTFPWLATGVIATAALAIGLILFLWVWRNRKKKTPSPLPVKTNAIDDKLSLIPEVKKENPDEFINEARAIVIANLQNEDFDVNMLCRELGTSRSQLYRKFKEQGGYSVSTFIKEIKLSRAEHLLQKSELSISEVSQLSGFKSPSHFTKTFQSKFGLTPSEYSGKHKNKTGVH